MEGRTRNQSRIKRVRATLFYPQTNLTTSMWSVNYTPLELENEECLILDWAENRDVVHAGQKEAISFSSLLVMCHFSFITNAECMLGQQTH